MEYKKIIFVFLLGAMHHLVSMDNENRNGNPANEIYGIIKSLPQPQEAILSQREQIETALRLVCIKMQALQKKLRIKRKKNQIISKL